MAVCGPKRQILPIICIDSCWC